MSKKWVKPRLADRILDPNAFLIYLSSDTEDEGEDARPPSTEPSFALLQEKMEQMRQAIAAKERNVTSRSQNKHESIASTESQKPTKKANAKTQPSGGSVNMTKLQTEIEMLRKKIAISETSSTTTTAKKGACAPKRAQSAPTPKQSNSATRGSLSNASNPTPITTPSSTSLAQPLAIPKSSSQATPNATAISHLHPRATLANLDSTENVAIDRLSASAVHPIVGGTHSQTQPAPSTSAVARTTVGPSSQANDDKQQQQQHPTTTTAATVPEDKNQRASVPAAVASPDTKKLKPTNAPGSQIQSSHGATNGVTQSNQPAPVLTSSTASGRVSSSVVLATNTPSNANAHDTPTTTSNNHSIPPTASAPGHHMLTRSHDAELLPTRTRRTATRLSHTSAASSAHPTTTTAQHDALGSPPSDSFHMVTRSASHKPSLSLPAITPLSREEFERLQKSARLGDGLLPDPVHALAAPMQTWLPLASFGEVPRSTSPASSKDTANTRSRLPVASAGGQVPQTSSPAPVNDEVNARLRLLVEREEAQRAREKEEREREELLREKRQRQREREKRASEREAQERELREQARKVRQKRQLEREQQQLRERLEQIRRRKETERKQSNNKHVHPASSSVEMQRENDQSMSGVVRNSSSTFPVRESGVPEYSSLESAFPESTFPRSGFPESGTSETCLPESILPESGCPNSACGDQSLSAETLDAALDCTMYDDTEVGPQTPSPPPPPPPSVPPPPSPPLAPSPALGLSMGQTPTALLEARVAGKKRSLSPQSHAEVQHKRRLMWQQTAKQIMVPSDHPLSQQEHVESLMPSERLSYADDELRRCERDSAVLKAQLAALAVLEEQCSATLSSARAEVHELEAASAASLALLVSAQDEMYSQHVLLLEDIVARQFDVG